MEADGAEERNKDLERCEAREMDEEELREQDCCLG